MNGCTEISISYDELKGYCVIEEHAKIRVSYRFKLLEEGNPEETVKKIRALL